MNSVMKNDLSGNIGLATAASMQLGVYVPLDRRLSL